MAQLPSRNHFSVSELIAGVSVALILIPQSLAYAEIAGLPSYIGLYAAALPPIAMSLFTSSRYLQTGPVAMTSLLTFGALTGLAPIGTPEYVKLASMLAIVVAATRFLLGIARVGKIVYLMTAPVLLGFTTAAAILIISSQLPRALGVDAPDDGLLERAWYSIVHPAEWETIAIVLSALAIVIVLGGRRISRIFPGVLIAVVGAIVFSSVIGYAGSIVGDIPTGLPPISLDLPFGEIPMLIIGGIVIALVGFAEPAAIARTFADEDDEHWDASRELVASGFANFVSGLSGGYPIGGSFSRSSVNRMAGGRSRWAGAVTGFTVLAFLPFAGVLSPLPRAVLSAIVIAAVYQLVKVGRLVSLLRREPLNGLVAFVTFAATLALAPRIDQGIIIGIVIGVGASLWQRRLGGPEAVPPSAVPADELTIE